MKEYTFIVDAKRTAVGKFGGSLLNTSATTLASTVISRILKENPRLKNHIDEVILGNTLSSGLGQNPARIAAIKSGLTNTTPAFTVNKVCGSGLKSITLAALEILHGDAELIIAGGMENMSRAPYILEDYRFGTKAGHQTIKDSMIYDGLFCSLIGEHMGITAENVAKKYKITRKKQDEFAVNSHKKALLAISKGKFKKEIIPVRIKRGGIESNFEIDEQPRADTTYATIAKLNSAFKKNGSVTAANASPLNDGASIVIVASKSAIKKHFLKPMAKIISFSSVALDPNYMGMGAYHATIKALAKTNLKPKDINLWELNEAFASQSIAVIEKLKIDPEKVNVNGGAIALGHPIGASGARILTTLVHELKRQSKQYGVASLCIGGGQGIAMVVENI